LAESYERIHRANLVGVGILPLTFGRGENRKTLGLTGRERFRVRGLRHGVVVGGALDLDFTREDGVTHTVVVDVSLESEKEIHVLRRGGLLPMLLHELTAAG
jgi:aconitase A